MPLLYRISADCQPAALAARDAAIRSCSCESCWARKVGVPRCALVAALLGHCDEAEGLPP